MSMSDVLWAVFRQNHLAICIFRASASESGFDFYFDAFMPTLLAIVSQNLVRMCGVKESSRSKGKHEYMSQMFSPAISRRQLITLRKRIALWKS